MPRNKDALDHSTRKMIYSYILTHPGASFGHIKKFFGLNDSTLKYHLKFMERTKKVESRKEGKRRLYFCTGVEKPERIPTPVMILNLLNETQKSVLEAIRQKPRITRQELNAYLNLKPKTMEYTLNKLMELKLIWKLQDKTGVRFEYITKERIKAEMLNRLAYRLISKQIDEETYHRTRRRLDDMDIDEIEI